MKPISFYSDSPLARNIQEMYGCFGQKMSVKEAIDMSQTILQLVRLGQNEDVGVLVFLAQLIYERTIAGETAVPIPESIPFNPPVTFELPY